ncbi:MAG: hypothetical protein HY299_14035 [Verrucomicrobia bacterium]|nr:hypothetical protein [Verrucomicrobiota bacterium]
MKNLLPVALAAVLLLTRFQPVLAEAAPPQPATRGWADAVESALVQAGTNRQELVLALEKTSGEQRDSVEFLITNMPPRDLQSLSSQFLLENVSLARKALEDAPWARSVPREVFLNDILPYASVTEQRDNWRQRIHDICQPLVKECKTAGQAAQALNQKIFPLLKVKYSTQRRVADQGPLETMRTGVATCTGLSILLVDACRSVGVPARVVGTPMWSNNSGNHTWVEIWDGDWHFVGAAEPDPKGLDRGWFVGNASQAVRNDRAHAIYASSFKKTGLTFPLGWTRGDAEYVSAVNVTDRYASGDKAVDVATTRLQVNALNRPMGQRVAARVTITDTVDAALRFEGTSKTEPADMNDHMGFKLPQRRTYIIDAEQGGQKVRKYYSPGTNKEDLLVLHLSGVPVVIASGPGYCAAPSRKKPLDAKEEAALKGAAKAYFSATGEKQATFKFPSALNSLLSRNEPAVRRAVWDAYLSAPIHEALRLSYGENQVRSGKYASPYTVKTVGKRPPNGWGLFIAMHGGGGVPQEINDSQWRHMQIYYRDHPEVGGYRYVALRAPNNEWNGFYTGYVYPLIASLVRQFVIFGDVDPNKVFVMGYSHGGYGAFAIGPKMPDRFAAVHASAGAPADGILPQSLRNTPFTYMVGEKDTAYGRIDRNREFDQAIGKLRGDRRDIFPVTLTVIADHPHSGLPDRDKIAEMYPAVRNPVPTDLTWPLTDAVVRDFFWLEAPHPEKGQEFDASCHDNRLTVRTTNLAEGAILLDGRLVDFRERLTLDLNGRVSRIKLTPSLRTLCETMLRRGDPDLAFTSRLDLPLKSGARADARK